MPSLRMRINHLMKRSTIPIIIIISLCSYYDASLSSSSGSLSVSNHPAVVLAWSTIPTIRGIQRNRIMNADHSCRHHHHHHHHRSQKIYITTSNFHKATNHNTVVLTPSLSASSTEAEADIGGNGRIQQQQQQQQQHRIEVVYEDEDYFFVRKPPNMVCTGGDIAGGGVGGVSFHDLVKEYGRTQYGGYQPGLLHRLDQGTSGVMVYAKSRTAAQHYLTLQQKQGAITKQYIAIVQGAPPKPRGRIEGGICKSHDLRTYVIRPGRKSGKRVLTTYKMLWQRQHDDNTEDEDKDAAMVKKKDGDDNDIKNEGRHPYLRRQFGTISCLSLRVSTVYTVLGINHSDNFCVHERDCSTFLICRFCINTFDRIPSLLRTYTHTHTIHYECLFTGIQYNTYNFFWGHVALHGKETSNSCLLPKNGMSDCGRYHVWRSTKQPRHAVACTQYCLCGCQ